MWQCGMQPWRAACSATSRAEGGISRRTRLIDYSDAAGGEVDEEWASVAGVGHDQHVRVITGLRGIELDIDQTVCMAL